MDKDTQEQYEYARKRLRQKKRLYYHFVLFLIGSLFMFVANEFLMLGAPFEWDVWVSTVWFFVWILHFIKIYITDRFMNKQWENEQIERLVNRQKNRIQQLDSKINQDQK